MKFASLLLTFILLCLLSPLASAQTQDILSRLTNKEILETTSAEISSDVIIAKIKLRRSK